MNRSVTILLLTLFLANCEGQTSRTTSNSIKQDCNRTVYGTPGYIKSLPAYICIPPHFIIDDYVRVSDLNDDGKNDFLAIKYNKKEDDQVDGDTTYWAFYYRGKTDTTYSLKMVLSNIVPPFIRKMSGDYLLSHPKAAKLVEDYPLRLINHSLSFQVSDDTIRLSYKFEDTYGKTFVFVADETNWYLENVEYFIGELPMYWWKEDEFYYPLNDRLKVIETRRPKKRVSINEFDLKVAFKYREDQWVHLAEWHIDQLDKTKWTSIEEVKFNNCSTMDLPDDWVY